MFLRFTTQSYLGSNLSRTAESRKPFRVREPWLPADLLVANDVVHRHIEFGRRLLAGVGRRWRGFGNGSPCAHPIRRAWCDHFVRCDRAYRLREIVRNYCGRKALHGVMPVSRLALCASPVLLLWLFTVSSLADIRPLESAASMPASGGSSNPIRLEGQIREVTITGDTVIVRLHRDRYPIVATRVTRVRWLDGRRALASDLQKGDSIRVQGHQEKNEIVADRVTILLRIEHRP